MAKAVTSTPKTRDYISAVGKRKSAIARIRLYEDVKKYPAEGNLPAGRQEIQKGDVFINNKKIGEVYSDKVSQVVYNEPFRITNTEGKYVLTIKTVGGGKKGQLSAIVHGISRALSLLDPKNRAILKKGGFLTRDARVRERRKVGMGGKARRKKQSPKR